MTTPAAEACTWLSEQVAPAVSVEAQTEKSIVSPQTER